MNTTLSVTMPENLKQALEGQVRAGWYASINEAVKEGVKLLIKGKPQLTANGFTEEFEEGVLRAAQEPRNPKRVWNGKGSFTDFVLRSR